MSTKHNEINEKQFITTYIKLENDSDDDVTNEKSLELNNNNKDYYSNLSSTSAIINPALINAYKGKIEVTSKGRRKIFDGVRWQILCKRPECRKQTNKKSLCITHYKEDYESNTRSSSSSSSWSNNLPSFQFPSYKQRHTYDNPKARLEIEDQNNTITTTNLTENDEQLSLQSIREGQIEYIHNGRRFILKNSKYQPLCKYDNNCCNIAKYESLCLKHFELTQQKRRNTFKFHNNDNRRLHPSIINNHRHPIFSNDITKRLKTSSSLIEQFDINSNENNSTLTKIVNNDFSILTSKLPGHEQSTSSKKNLNILSSDNSLVNNQKSEHKNDQSVQTDLSIPLCCIIHQEGHSFSTLCKNNVRK